MSLRLNVGRTASEHSDWVSDTSLRVMSGQGMLGSRITVISALFNVGSVSAMFSAGQRTISLVVRANQAASGASSMTVHGAGFGLTWFTSALRPGRTDCEVTAWTADTTVLGQAGPGIGRSRVLSVSFGLHIGTVTSLYSSQSGFASSGSRANGAATGSTCMTMSSVGLGLFGFSGVVGHAGHSPCQRTAWTSDTSVRCSVGNGGVGSRMVSLSIDNLVGSVSRFFSTDMLSASTVMQSNGASSGSISISVFYAQLGLTRYKNSYKLTMHPPSYQNKILPNTLGQDMTHFPFPIFFIPLNWQQMKACF
jgi:hypothetical protein